MYLDSLKEQAEKLEINIKEISDEKDKKKPLKKEKMDEVSRNKKDL